MEWEISTVAPKPTQDLHRGGSQMRHAPWACSSKERFDGQGEQQHTHWQSDILGWLAFVRDA